MALRIRMTRGGAKKRPYYSIVVAEGASPRDGKFLEKIGRFHPMEKENQVVLDKARAQFWMDRGALPSDTVARFLKAEGFKVEVPVRKPAGGAKSAKA